MRQGAAALILVSVSLAGDSLVCCFDGMWRDGHFLEPNLLNAGSGFRLGVKQAETFARDPPSLGSLPASESRCFRLAKRLTSLE